MTYNREMTLLSFAMLKEKIDNNSSYIEYFEPYILHCINELKKHNTIIIDNTVQQSLKAIFGLNIPQRTINLMLQRISRKGFIQKTNKIYYITSKFPQDNSNKIHNDINEFQEKVDNIIQSLISFASKEFNRDFDEEKALATLLLFFSNFGITCLDTFLSNSTIPEESYKDTTDNELIIIANFINYINNTNLEIFHSLLILLEGCMCANSLLCPELENAPKNFKDVTFYFDVKPLLHILELEDPESNNLTKQLVNIIIQLKGQLAYFEHTLDELIAIIEAALYTPDARGSIADRLRTGKLKKSKLQPYTDREYVKKILQVKQFTWKKTPSYEYKCNSENSQINEIKLEEIIENYKLRYMRNEAKARDINSIRSIYAIRKKARPRSIEKCIAILVTHNKKLALCAKEYGKYECDVEVTPAIDDYSLINLAWLKTPVDRADITRKELMAQAYSLLLPSDKFINKILQIAQTMRDNNDITLDEYAILRSDPKIARELYNMTLGEDEDLSMPSLQEVLKRHTLAIEKNTREDEKRNTEKEKREKLKYQKRSLSLLKQNTNFKNRLKQIAFVCSWLIHIIVSVGIYCIYNAFEINNLIENLIRKQLNNNILKICAYALIFILVHFVSPKIKKSFSRKKIQAQIYKRILNFLISSK